MNLLVRGPSDYAATGMAGLDDLQRIAMEWKYIDGLTVREIAEQLGRAEKAIEGILYRARTAFRAQCKRITQ